MTKTRNWPTRAMYIIVALAMTLGLLVVPTGGSVLGQDPDLFKLEPSLALNVKGAIEKYIITYDGFTQLPAVNITQWRVTSNWMATPATIVDGGQPGDTWIRVQATEPGEAHMFADIDIDLDGIVDITLDAEKKWGEINCTELTSESLGWNSYLATELVKANFIWGAPGDVYELLPADDAVVHWYLMDIDALTDADNLNGGVGILDIEAALGDDPCDKDGGCGKWTWDPTKLPEEQLNDPFNRLDWLQDLYPVDHSTAYLYDGSAGTVIDWDADYATSTTEEDGTTYMGVYAASASSVLLVTLAEYPVNYHGENVECVQHETFKPVIPPAQVKSPQLRWAGEKIVLEKDWDVNPYFSWERYSDGYYWYYDLELHLYFAIYSLEEGSIGNLEPVMDTHMVTWEFYDSWGWDGTVNINMNSLGLPTGAQQVICPLGGYYYEYDFGDYYGYDYGYGELYDYTDTEAIFVSEQSGQADVNVALYEVIVSIDQWTDPYYYLGETWTSLDINGPVAEHGFLLYYLEFEEVSLAEDITPASDLAGVYSDEPVDVAVQVKGFFDYRHSHLMATTRPEKMLDLDGDFVPDVILPAGRYVLPDDWWILAGTKDVSLRPNWDMMDMAHHDDVVSTDELGPYAPVAAADPLEEAEWPCIGPFNTLQGWSSDLTWITSATVPSSYWWSRTRNTVVPDGEDLNWYDAPMPQALVTFEVIDYDAVVNHSLSGLDKGDLEGYGFEWVGDDKIYQSPFYAVEIPAHWQIPPGYDWLSWERDPWGWWRYVSIWGPYDYWTDLGIKSFPGDPEPDQVNDQDVEVYCDNHGIAAVTVDPLDAQGALTITATADYPYQPLRGKYGPRVSPPIEIGSRTDLNPHFVVDKVEVAVGETVIFDPTSTYGGTTIGGAYQRARWDFDSDGVWDEDSYLTGKDPLALTTWAYSAEGEYNPCLEITDFSVPVVVRTECMSDPYSIIVGAGITKITWTLPYGLDADPAAVNIWTYPSYGVEVTLADVDATMPDGLLIWYYGGPTVGWQFYKKGWGATNTLTSLVATEAYIGIVPTATVWHIPQV